MLITRFAATWTSRSATAASRVTPSQSFGRSRPVPHTVTAAAAHAAPHHIMPRHASTPVLMTTYPATPRPAPLSAITTAFGCVRQAISYIGLDIVKKVIDTNLVKRDNMTRLVQADVVSLTQLPGPTADLIFSRQMMQHMCNSDVRHVLDLISRSGARFALLTHFETAEGMANSDIHCNSGGYRPQDLRKPPFSLPPPIRYWCVTGRAHALCDCDATHSRVRLRSQVRELQHRQTGRSRPMGAAAASKSAGHAHAHVRPARRKR